MASHLPQPTHTAIPRARMEGEKRNDNPRRREFQSDHIPVTKFEKQKRNIREWMVIGNSIVVSLLLRRGRFRKHLRRSLCGKCCMCSRPDIQTKIAGQKCNVPAALWNYHWDSRMPFFLQLSTCCLNKKGFVLCSGHPLRPTCLWLTTQQHRSFPKAEKREIGGPNLRANQPMKCRDILCGGGSPTVPFKKSFQIWLLGQGRRNSPRNKIFTFLQNFFCLVY